MKQRPIIFNTEMVRAILDGRKTQTRRPFKTTEHGIFNGVRKKGSKDEFWVWPNAKSQIINECSLGNVGDRLWVRETMTMEKWPDLHYVCGGLSVGTGDEDFSYRTENYRGFIPSIHMPKWASRILLEVTDIRVERLNDISEADAKAEGINCVTFRNECLGCCEGFTHRQDDGKCQLARTAKSAFLNLWDSIYRNANTNPWVWVIEFKVISTTGGAA
jgi:hypothetical protein